MKYKPNKQLRCSHIFMGTVRLDAGDNNLTKVQLDVLKAHPSYAYYIEQGILTPNTQEAKPNGKERAIAKKKAEAEVSSEELKLAIEKETGGKVEPVTEEVKPKRRRLRRKKAEEASND